MQYIATSILCLVMLIGADAFAMSKMDTFRAFRPADPIREVGCSFVFYSRLAMLDTRTSTIILSLGR